MTLLFYFLAALAAFLAGMALGTVLKRPRAAERGRSAAEEDTLLRLGEEQDAFRLLQQYSAETAYGLGRETPEGSEGM